ncbi:MAG TPA: class II aldolase/adducin family protein [Ramlibacter sp.]|jgi:ribulose-5-phosphate 4-epimerase/fuculose-1-phosphate aldolase|nr:class II aldolase/adducin family protein [Ramlibacter sp.]
MNDAEWKVRVGLAACYRLVAQNGWTDLIFTHISARVPGSDHHYLINPFGLAFDEVTASNLVKIDLDGNKVDPSEHRIHKAGFVIHSAVHQAREDANCIIHLHTPAGMAMSALQCGLLPLTQHAMLFTGKVGYHESEGLALDLAERERLARDLGTNCVLVLKNHGTLVVGSTVAEAFSMQWHLEQACKAQMMALASGQPLNQPPAGIPEAIARLGFNTKRLDEYTEGRSPLGWMEWPSLLRRLDRTDPGFRQ